MDSVNHSDLDEDSTSELVPIINKPRESIHAQLHYGPRREHFTAQKPANTEVQYTRLQRMMLNHSVELRSRIKNFQNSLTEISVVNEEQCNIILFGPSGSGKSSLINTLFMALHGEIDSYHAQLLQIKKLNENEGTKQFTKFTLRKPNRVQIHGRRSLQSYKSEINLMDTRGQILLNSNEKKQMELLLDGRVKHMSTVKQRTYRYSYLLWEFWRQDHELFPSEILENNLSNHPHCIVLVFDGSLEQVPNGDEETQFYREILNEMDRRGYGVPQVVLTHLDQSDQSVEAEYMETIDKKINSVVQRLRIPRRNVHFIENYHEKVKDYIPVNYYALKLLEQCLHQGQSYLHGNLQSMLNGSNGCHYF